MFKITEEWIDQFRTGTGGWTKDQLRQIGVDWPPVRGWKRRVEGNYISQEQRKRFEEQRPRTSLPLDL